MASERFCNYEFEISAARLPDGKWIPYLEIKIYSDDQVEEDVIFPRQRIAEEDVFNSEEAAIDEARRFAMNHVSSGEF
jgi:hypothetical protein